MLTITRFQCSCLSVMWSMLTCVCTFLMDGNNEHDDGDIHIEQISKNFDFWGECVVKARQFFGMCLLPVLMGN